ncbi:hypothetical protein MMYC01_203208 [Madurella mycetomatis]|uniref:Uncharacterized protein n=1 Tax=Madurella mycetomatis TaxID=100816 RepID=A0A175VX12_9PEZI|nr:hypothetical protein MMYC01_208054 [Madurella mycetomatis]KXX81248.1 hypothetical protein MMYC01_203208 [Madurella mycetomatis]
MCLTKVYYNTYSDGTQDVTEKHYACRDGRGCSKPEVRKYDRKFPFTKLGEARTESHKSLAERKPTPYFTPHMLGEPKSPSPSGKRSSDIYMSGAKHYDNHDVYGRYDLYDHRLSSTRDPRDSYGRETRDSRTKRSTAAPQIIYMDRDKPSRSCSHSGSRDYSRDVLLGPVHLVHEYDRQRSSRSRSREGSREGSDHSSSKYNRRRTDDPLGYVLIDDQDERRRQRREQRRLSASSYADASTSAATDVYDPSRYIPRRASTVVHRSDGSISTTSSSSSKPKQLRWEDQVRAKRDRQNAEIANRPILGEPKSILKHTSSTRKGKGRELDEIDELRRSIERMEIPRGRDREPRSARWYDEEPDRERRKRSKALAGDDGYRYY